MLAHQIPMLISIMDHVFMGTEAWKGSLAYHRSHISIAYAREIQGGYGGEGTYHGEYAYGV
jgi:hypothetical protein